ncbi:condensation domain-containing protein, partial [Amycolatopsis cihanbeyliensis]
MKRSRIEDILPLSPLQEGLLFQAQYDDDAMDVYTTQLAVKLEGELDVRALRAAAGTVLGRHANLRAGFRRRKNGEPMQVIQRDVELPWSELDLSGCTEDELSDRLREFLAGERAQRFDLERPPLLRFTLIRLSADSYWFVLTTHHILLDGWSSPLLIQELLTLYAEGGRADALPPVTPYRNYLAWLGKQDREAAKEAWRDALSGVDSPTLVAPAASNLVTSPPEDVLTELSEEVTSGLTTLAREHGLTLNTMVQAAWGLLVGKLTGQNDVVFGGTVSGRPADIPGVETMIGLFINTLPVRVRVDPAESWLELLDRVQRQQGELLDYHHIPLSEAQAQTSVNGRLFDTLVVFENYPVGGGDGDGMQAGPLRVTGATGQDATHYPLTLFPIPGRTLRLRLGYRPDVFDREEAERVLERLVSVLNQLHDAPSLPVGRVDVLSGVERDCVLVGWNGS